MSCDTYTDGIVGITRNICHIYLLNACYTLQIHSLTPEEGSQIQWWLTIMQNLYDTLKL